MKEAIKGKSFQDIVRWRDDKIVDILSIKEDEFWGDPMSFPVYDRKNIAQNKDKEDQKKPAEVRKIKEQVA
jgi:hypothetical protein